MNFIKEIIKIKGLNIDKYIGEFWTAKQRQMHSLHYVVSYRASFKPELPNFFIKNFSNKEDVIFDPFAGRGTTILEANLLERIGWANDVNPLSNLFCYSKTHPVKIEQIKERLNCFNLQKQINCENDLYMFYHNDTYKELLNLKEYIRNNFDDINRFIQLIAISRLHGHSKGFFSVYSFPQISIPKENQIKINQKRNQIPEYRDVKKLILRKAKSSLKDNKINEINKISQNNLYTINDATDLKDIPSDSVSLIITSPPFLDKADYIMDNWLELWFVDISIKSLKNKIMQTGNLDVWKSFIKNSMKEMYRVLKSNGLMAIEVGEVKYKNQIINLDEILIELCFELYEEGYDMLPKKIFIHQQEFTKLANCFNVSNNKKGTNTHRIVLFEKRS